MIQVLKSGGQFFLSGMLVQKFHEPFFLRSKKNRPVQTGVGDVGIHHLIQFPKFENFSAQLCFG